MSDLCQRLQNKDEAGVYQLSCPVEVLHGNADLAELRMFEIDLAKVHGKGEFLAAVAKAIQAPDWFGHNFDALSDALGDLTWLDGDDESKGYVLLLQNADENLNLTAAEKQLVTEIFNETVTYWQSEGKPFWVFIA